MWKKYETTPFRSARQSKEKLPRSVYTGMLTSVDERPCLRNRKDVRRRNCTYSSMFGDREFICYVKNSFDPDLQQRDPSVVSTLDR